MHEHPPRDIDETPAPDGDESSSLPAEEDREDLTSAASSHDPKTPDKGWDEGGP
jgi:hypothetical protein